MRGLAVPLLLFCTVVTLLPQANADSALDLFKFLGCFAKLNDVSGACGEKNREYQEASDKFTQSTDPAKDRKGVCCRLSNLMDCYIENVKRHCSDGASKFIISYVEGITQAKVREACYKFDGNICLSGTAITTVSISLLGLAVALATVLL